MFLFTAVTLLSVLVTAHANQICTPNGQRNETIDAADDPTWKMKSVDCPGAGAGGFCGRKEASETADYICCEDNGPELDGFSFDIDTPDGTNIIFTPGISSATYLRFIDRDVGYVCTGLQTGAMCNTDRRYLYPDNDSHDLCSSGACGMNGKCLDSKQPTGAECYPIGRSNGPPTSKSCQSSVCAQRGIGTDSVCCESEEDAIELKDAASGFTCVGLARGGDRCGGKNSMCASGICNPDGRCKGLGLSSGEPCQGINEDCESKMCSLGVCIDDRLPDGSPCSDDSTCQSGGCGARSREDLVSFFEGLEFNMTRQIIEAKEAYHESDPWPYVCCRRGQWYHENGVVWAFADICDSDPNGAEELALLSWIWLVIPLLILFR
mmetsp:Transcript_19538/g.45843  ORF Transcript_19538/g.45843 Transcript_19538/m.45843 type:complete len:379 (-) Transcript_19538:81-1217(-)